MKFVPCLFALVLWSSTVVAQETPLVTLDEVVITADRRETPLKDTPEIIQVVGEEEIRSLNASSTGEVLEAVVGLNTMTGTGSGFPKRSVVSLNGLPAQYVLVLVNGQRLLTEHIHTGQNVDMIPPECIERIEIIKTAASAQYGSDAMGGVVNIITKGAVKKPRGKAYAAYGSNAAVNAGLGVATKVGERIAVSMFADYDRTDGVAILAPAHRLDNLGYDRFSSLNNVEVQVTRWMQADLYFNYFENRMGWMDGDAYSRLMMPKADLHFDVNKHWRVTGTLEYSHWESEVSTETNKILEPKLFATWSSWKGRNLLTFGGDFRNHEFMRTGLAEEKTQWAYGVFAHDSLVLNKQWSFSLSARMDHVDGLDPVFSPKGAVLYRPIPELGVRLAVGRGFHAPTVQELYEEGYGHGGTAYRFGNPDLKPETSTAFSLSLEASPIPSLQLFANGYFHLIDNFIVPQFEGPWKDDPNPSADGPPKNIWRRENILRAWVYGGEFTAKWTPLDWLRLQAGYSYAANRDESDEKQLNYHPGHSAFGKIDFRFVIARDFSVNVFAKALHRAGRSAWSWKPAGGAEADNEAGKLTDLADYTLLDSGAQVGWRKYNFYVTVTNLLSEDIERLDDALTIIDGEPLFRVGVRGRF